MVVNGEGWCYIFDFLTDTSNDGEFPMKPTHVQRIPANTKVLLLHDVNSDGLSKNTFITSMQRLIKQFYFYHFSFLLQLNW